MTKELNRSSKPELYAVTSSLECFRMMMSIAIDFIVAESMSIFRSIKLMIYDVSRVYCYVFVIRWVYIKIVDEDFAPDDENKCDRLNVSMHGTRDAAMN